MRLKLTYFLFVAFVLQIPFSSVHAQEKGKGFMVNVRTDKGEIPVRFFEVEHHAWLGYGDYLHPIVPVEMRGEIFMFTRFRKGPSRAVGTLPKSICLTRYNTYLIALFRIVHLFAKSLSLIYSRLFILCLLRDVMPCDVYS